jgi:hypothetical protein
MNSHQSFLCVLILAGLASRCAGVEGPQGPPGPAGGATDLRGKAVQLPDGGSDVYSIVAAGVVTAGMVRRPFNGLRVVGFNDSTGVLTLSYGGYRVPDETRELIVKALASDTNEFGGPYEVHFRSFSPDGIVLRVTDSDGRAAAPSRVRVFVEVTEYGPGS